MRLRICRTICLLIVLCGLLAGQVLAQSTVLGTNTGAPIANSGTTGTTLYRLAKIVNTGGISTALIAATSDTAIPLYIVTYGAGTSGTAMLNIAGVAPCVFDSAASNMAGKYVVASTTSAGACHVQASPPANGIVVGVLWDNATVDGTSSGVTALVQSGNLVYVPGTPGSGSGTVASGIAHSLAYYSGTPDATTVDDLPATPTANRYLKGNGTDWSTSAGAASGIGACSNQAVTALNSDAAPTCTTITSAFVNSTIGVTGGDLDASTPSQVTGATRAFALRGDLTPTALAGNINDYNPTNLTDAAILRIDTGSAAVPPVRLMTGLSGGADGRVMQLRNIGAVNALTLVNQSSSSSPANQFFLTSDLTLPPGASATLIYDATLARWVTFNNTIQDAYATRSCEVDIGSVSTPVQPIAADENLPTTCGNRYGKAWKLTGFACKANTGTVVMRPILTGGTNTSIVTADVSCGTSWTPGVMNGLPVVNSFGADAAACATAPCTVDFVMVNPGTANRVQMVLTGSLQR